ncbi:uncharacterized protein BCR38DRAFT_517016 [Pseudomassariella vexata]|uniref:Protein HRI1 n=1 Tax=Pseudomassariella vexata TaxID=1141098 RepID=A0A1Y2DW75_9PEZI|nr:uncharacterized protein BCR38DRAFT_517016 [Pseudomassariella vexata]ORY63518.1 hypothetical protein BCR38DRAFT_517016 [Pseudomassariella vexata]
MQMGSNLAPFRLASSVSRWKSRVLGKEEGQQLLKMTDENTKPSVSIRKYIKWGDAPPSEPTSTLVLTSPQRRFVDVRLLLPLPSVSEKQLDWAFAGTSEHNAKEKPPHSVFRHWVDSRYVDAEKVSDEGDVFEGDEGTGVRGEVLERGKMENPDSGRVEEYEECWVDGLERDGKMGVGGWVLRFEDGDEKDGRTRGMMVRIGEVVQGILRIGGEVGVGRWKIGAQGGEREREFVAEIGKCEEFPTEGWGEVKSVTGGISCTLYVTRLIQSEGYKSMTTFKGCECRDSHTKCFWTMIVVTNYYLAGNGLYDIRARKAPVLEVAKRLLYIENLNPWDILSLAATTSLSEASYSMPRSQSVLTALALQKGGFWGSLTSVQSTGFSR